MVLATKLKKTLIPFLLLFVLETIDSHSDPTLESQPASARYSLIYEIGSDIFTGRGEMNLYDLGKKVDKETIRNNSYKCERESFASSSAKVRTRTF